MSNPVPVNRGGQLVLAALAAKGLTINEWSRLRDIGQGVLSRTIRGKRACSRELALCALKDFGVPVESWDQKPVGRPRGTEAAA